jgi:SPOR domain
MNRIRHNNTCKSTKTAIFALCVLSFAMIANELSAQVVTLASDTTVVPAKYSRGSAGASRLVLIDPGADKSRSNSTQQTADTLPAQVFRVQLYTSKLYGDATRMTRIGRELCLSPVTLDYDVPYYKIRAGAFASRIEAEQHVARAKQLGFSEAWVVVTANPLRKSTPNFSDSTSTAKIGQDGE